MDRLAISSTRHDAGGRSDSVGGLRGQKRFSSNALLRQCPVAHQPNPFHAIADLAADLLGGPFGYQLRSLAALRAVNGEVNAVRFDESFRPPDNPAPRVDVFILNHVGQFATNLARKLRRGLHRCCPKDQK